MSAIPSLRNLQTPSDQGLTLALRTLTPLYTGGIGQSGDQIHPSGLLGGVRNMSCLVANTLGDGGFEARVWGSAGTKEVRAHAKRVSLAWKTDKLHKHTLSERGVIELKRPDTKPARWYFNQYHEGALGLTVTRREISDDDWTILITALLIQVRYGTFGAKDQFGFGVLDFEAAPPNFGGLEPSASKGKAITQGGRLNLLRAAFATVTFRKIPGSNPRLTRDLALKLGLATRSALRGAIRASDSDSDAVRDRLTALRHQMFGSLNQSASAVNVSAAYGDEFHPSLRLWAMLKPEDKAERDEVFRRLRQSQEQIDSLISEFGYKIDKIDWIFGGSKANEKVSWLNQLAGVSR